MTSKEQARQERADALARCTQTVQTDAHAEQLIQATTALLLADLRAAGRDWFSADDMGEAFDRLGIVRDLPTRRRLTSVLITRGAGRQWRRVGWVRSTRRKCSPIGQWQVIPC
jgi:hypothetical protein